MQHPGGTDLALFAGGELGLLAKLRVRRHISRCARCRAEAEGYAAARNWLRWTADEFPADANWSRLSAEMRGNIRVGLAAGECVGPAEQRLPRLGWRTAATLAPVTLLVLVGLWLQPRTPEVAAGPDADGILLQATSEGIELRQGGGVLSLQHPAARGVTFTVNVQGTLRARYVDVETGQVTINHVYAQ